MTGHAGETCLLLFYYTEKGSDTIGAKKEGWACFACMETAIMIEKCQGAEVVGMAIELKRDIYEELLQWKKNNSGLVLEVEGARQVGKTYILDKFAREQYEQYIYINMIGKSGQDFLNCYNAIYHWEVGQQRREGALHDVFKAYAPDFEDKKSTVVVIDEIQESSVVYSCIREFARAFTCDFIVTGSYLGKTREKDFFLSAGDTDNLVLGTLTFPEFLEALGKREVYQNLSLYGEDPHKEYDEIKEYFDVYCQIGGYPKVVQTYLETRSIEACRKVLDKLSESS